MLHDQKIVLLQTEQPMCQILNAMDALWLHFRNIYNATRELCTSLSNMTVVGRIDKKLQVVF